jgi:hypothetical protein
LDQVRFAPDPFHRIAQYMLQMGDVEAAHIAQLDAFKLLPEALARVRIRGIRRQAL